MPDEAFGDCTESADCTGADAYCVFYKSEVDGEKSWSPSTCGVEADCNEAVNEANMTDEDYDRDNYDKQFCKEFSSSYGSGSGDGKDRECPEKAAGECIESSDCTETDAYCVFNKITTDGETDWNPSTCGVV